MSAETEQRALAIVERLTERPDDPRLRQRLLARESAAVRARVTALAGHLDTAGAMLPTELPDAPEPVEGWVPTRIGPFRLVERIGSGGMGEVWRATRDDGLYDQSVAIKLVHPHLRLRAGAAFDDERRFLARLEHPNIARLIDGGVTEGGAPWLMTEYVDGRPFDEGVAGLTLAERIKHFVMAADAVQFAHAKLVAHGDIKPANILIADGRVKLLDFGIGALIGDGAATGAARGAMTRGFASPERLAGDGPSIADDVFALGKVLADATGDGGDADVAAIVARATAPAAADRYGSVADLIADLDRWRERLPVKARPATPVYRARKFVARHWIGVGATAAALVLLATAALVATSSSHRAERMRLRAEARFDEVRGLAHFMLFDLYDGLARQPGTVARRAEIAATGARYLDQMRLSGETSPALLLDGARGFRRLAAIEGLPGISNLGDPAAAIVALSRADAVLAELLVKEPRNAAALAERGWVNADRWSLRGDDAGSPTANRDARRDFDAALAVEPANPSARFGRLMTEKNAGYELIWTADKPAEALPRLRAALAELREARWPKDQQAAATQLEINLLNRIGDALYYTDDIPGSLAPFREAAAIIDRRIASDGATPQWLILKGDAAFNISGSLGDSGHEAEALTVADKGVAVLRQLLGFGPDAAAEKKLLVLYGQQAALLGSLGRTRDALMPSGDSVRLREARLARSPGDPQRMRDLAIGLAPHAKLLAKAAMPREACAAATRTLAIWHDIRARGRLGALDARKNLPQSETLKKNLCAA